MQDLRIAPWETEALFDSCGGQMGFRKIAVGIGTRNGRNTTVRPNHLK